MTPLKPTIHVHTGSLEAAILTQVLYGIEEEQIPVQLVISDQIDAVSVAHQAALQSPLLVGVAVINDEVVVHYRNLSPTSPLFHIRRAGAKDNESLRHIGANAARLVKGVPFKSQLDNN